MTQAQHALIVAFLTKKCELIETVFIHEMTDHFVVSVEDRMTDSLSFGEALQQTIDDFGGPNNIQKMEWTYRKVFLKSLFRDWWALVKSQFATPKRVRTLLAVGLVTLASLCFGLMTSFRGVLEEEILWSSVQWVSGIWVVTLIWFLLQRVAPRIKKAVIVRFPTLLIRLLTYLLWAGGLLLCLGVSSQEMSWLVKGLSYSTLWSTLTILYLGLLDYSMQKDPDSWYQTSKTAGTWII